MFGFGDLVDPWEYRLVISAGIAVIAFGLGYGLRTIRRRYVQQRHPIFIDLITSVLLVGVLVVATLAIADVWDHTEELLDQLGFLQLEARASQVVMTIAILITIQVLVGIASRLLKDLTAEGGAITQHQREIALRTTQLTLWVGGAIVILGIWAVDLTGLLVGAGFMGIVIGLASRKTLGSLLAGFVLMFSRAFEVGDWVVIGDQEGIVSDIMMMSTRLQSRNGEYIVVPNDVITSEMVVNRSRQRQIRVEVEVGVDYDTDLDEAVETAERVLSEMPETDDHVLTEPSPDVLIRELGDSAIGLLVRVWVAPPLPGHVNRVRGLLVAGLKDAYDEAGIKIPYPQRELSGRSETDGFRITQEAAANQSGRPLSSSSSSDGSSS